MKIQRTIPPTAAPVDLMSILHGIAGLFIGKHYIKKVESEIKSYFGVKHVFLVSSGKAGLTLILQALRTLHPERNQVLIPAYTCFSVPSAIIKAGLKVSLCDIDPATLDFDYELFDKSLNNKTLCVVATHLFGIPSDMDRIRNICKDKTIPVVEDAAQAMGGTYNGKLLGTIGDVGFFSLGRGKNITCGSGGIIITNNDMMASAIEKEFSSLQRPSVLKNIQEIFEICVMSIFIFPCLYWWAAGLPFLKLGQTIFHKDFPLKKFCGMKAGLLINWTKKLNKFNLIRGENADYYYENLSLDKRLKNNNSIPYLRFPLIVKNREMRETISSLSIMEGLGISKMYPSSINDIEELVNDFKSQGFPSAYEIANSLLTIPTHQFISTNDRKRICALLNDLLLKSNFVSSLLPEGNSGSTWKS